MTKIINIGLNHNSAPVELRECLASKSDSIDEALTYFRDLSYIKESLFISTCNRVESLVITEDTEKAKESIISLMAMLGDLPRNHILPSLYIHEDMDAVKHIFMVASSLDSMVVGEPQILGQIKKAFSESVKKDTSGVTLNRIMHRAFHAAKRVRTETGICEAAVSISYAAVELAKKIFHDLDGKNILLVGAGEMAELAATHLISNGVTTMTVANRTFQRAVELAEDFGARPVSFEEISSQLIETDIVVTSTGSQEYVVTHEQVKNCMKKRHHKPLFFIDIAVPRDIQPEVNDLDNVYVYDIDELKGVIQLNIGQRQQQAVKAERIVQEEVIILEKWLKTLEVVPTIVSLKKKAASIVRSELKKSKSGLGELTSDQMKAIHTLTRSIAEKVLNDPILLLTKKTDRPTVNNYLDVTRKLFNLDRET